MEIAEDEEIKYGNNFQLRYVELKKKYAELKEENRKLKTKLRTQKKLTECVREATTEQVVSTIEKFEKDCISKDRIREKIEEIKNKKAEDMFITSTESELNTIFALEDLLKEV